MDKKLTKNKKPLADKEDKKTPPVKDLTKNKSRRDFITLTTCAMAGIGAASGLWPLVKSMNPSAEVLATSTVEVNLSGIQEGHGVKVKWQGKPVFIRRRTKQEIEAAKSCECEELEGSSIR